MATSPPPACSAKPLACWELTSQKTGAMKSASRLILAAPESASRPK